MKNIQMNGSHLQSKSKRNAGFIIDFLNSNCYKNLNDSLMQGEIQMINDRILITPDPDLADEAVWYKGKLVEYLHAARQAVNTQDIQSVQTIGHRMKGSAESFGFDQAGEIGKTLELNAKNNDVHAIEQALALLADYLDKVKIVSD